jgi:hypothetical protein
MNYFESCPESEFSVSEVSEVQDELNFDIQWGEGHHE